MAIAFLAAAVMSGCGDKPAARAGPTTAGQAYDAAHPGGAIPPGLHGVEASRAAIAAAVAAAADASPVLLPRWLPEGYLLAAPYIAVGDGSVRPNPEAWGESYRVSYTDGHALLVVTVGAERRPAGLAWRRLDQTMRGRPLLVAQLGGSTIVTTADRPLILVTGEGLSSASVVHVVQTIGPAD